MKQFIGNSIKTDMLDNEIFNGDGSEIKSGRLCLIQKHKGRSVKLQVFVRVYRSCFEQYIVLYRDAKFSLQSGYINLKNCIVDTIPGKQNQIRVTLNDFEGTGVVFETNSDNEAEEWVGALQPQILSSSPSKGSFSPNLSPVIPRSPLMPTLTEESDEDD